MQTHPPLQSGAPAPAQPATAAPHAFASAVDDAMPWYEASGPAWPPRLADQPAESVQPAAPGLPPPAIDVAPRPMGDAVVLAVDARALHAWLQADSRFRDWITRRIDEYGFVEGRDFRAFLRESSGGRQPREYLLALDMAKELAMVERTDQGRAARQYFIDCERRAQAGTLLRQNALEQQQAATTAALAGLQAQVQQLEQRAETRAWDHCPDNCEPISKVRERMNTRYGLPGWVVDEVVWRLPLSPRPHGLVRNARDEAKGAQYAVYAVADISRVFARFVDECVQETATRASHRDITRAFQLLRDGKKPRPLKAHTVGAEAAPAELQPA